jgi:hypothetical protein
LTSQHPAQFEAPQRGPGIVMPPSVQRMKAQYQGPLVIGRDVGSGVDARPHPPHPANTTTLNAATAVQTRIDSSR